MARVDESLPAAEAPGYWRCIDCGSPQSLALKCCLECGGSFRQSVDPLHGPRNAQRLALHGAAVMVVLWALIAAWIAGAWR